jgi:hypothetical protein
MTTDLPTVAPKTRNKKARQLLPGNPLFMINALHVYHNTRLKALPPG